MVQIVLRISHNWRPMVLVICLTLGLFLSGSVGAFRSSASTQTSSIIQYIHTTSGRHFYLTNVTYATDQVLTACAAGYHAASLWEMLDVSNLVYDNNHPAAFNRADSGKGPPSYWYGWARTGYDSSASSVTGTGNCLNWSSTSNSDYGVSIRLSNTWEAAPGDISTWDATSFNCSYTGPVWCVGNFYLHYLPLGLRSP